MATGLQQAVEFVQLLDGPASPVDLLIPSGGWISRNGFFMLRGDVPLGAMVRAQRKSWLKRVALALFGPFLVPQLPYASAFFRDQVRATRHACRRALIAAACSVPNPPARRRPNPICTRDAVT